MTTQLLSPNQASAQAIARAGHWTLGNGQALGLKARQASVLRIAAGRVWATFEGPHAGAPNDLGDLMLGPGDALAVGVGRQLVIEAWNRGSQEPVSFSFDPVSATAPVLARSSSRWNCTVLLPGREFAHAAGHALVALGRLAWGLASYAEFLVAGRGRVLGRFESNAP